MDSTSKKTFIENLASENRALYNSADGRGWLNRVDLTFDHLWVYLYELVQNALDASASSIAIRVTDNGDSLVFQHNGKQELEEKGVAGLSKVFSSTKGARSVGFMGIGFKSVFARFNEVHISGWGWALRYEITQDVGTEYGDVHRDYIGSVVPIWDDMIEAPDHGFTTRFAMHRPIDGVTHFESDLGHFLPVDDRSLLAILAMAGLRLLEVDGKTWELDICEESDGCFEVTALSNDENLLWRVFSVEFNPSREAIACFLEHRKIRPSQDESEQVYSDAARTRRVIGVLPLDNSGEPAPPTEGRVYAPLPTELMLPFGIHISADWLLNISRGDLRDIEDNPWQREIADKIGDVLALYLGWSASACLQLTVARKAFSIFRSALSGDGGLESLLASESWKTKFRERVEDAAVIPVWTDAVDKVAYSKPCDAVVPPEELAAAFGEQPELQPLVLLKGNVVVRSVLGPGALKLFQGIDLLPEMNPPELERLWAGGLEDWWTALPDKAETRRDLIFRVWSAVSKIVSREAWTDFSPSCVRSLSGEWITSREATFLNESLPGEGEPGGIQSRQLLQPFVRDDSRLDALWVNALRRGRSADYVTQAWRWIEEYARPISLREIATAAIDASNSSAEPDFTALVAFGHWARSRNRPDLLSRVVVVSNGAPSTIPVGEALLADPYVDRGQDRRHLFSDLPVIDRAYIDKDPVGAGTHDWRTFFERAGARGGLCVTAKKRTANQYRNHDVAAFLGIDVDSVRHSNNQGYTLLDYDFEPTIPISGTSEEVRFAIASWLEDGYRRLRRTGTRAASYSYYGQHKVYGTTPSLWVSKLSELNWVPCSDEKLRRPREVLERPDEARAGEPFTTLTDQLLQTLQQEGVVFGTSIPEVTSIRRLSLTGSHLDAVALARLLSECRKEAPSDAGRKHFNEALQTLTIPTTDAQRITLDRIVRRVGGHHRGTLAGWVVPLDRIDEILRIELEHADFPIEFPDTTSGRQALSYICAVWSRARTSADRLANEVRDVLPTAYAYCLDDLVENEALLNQWQSEVSAAMVFVDREWIAVADFDDIYIDDIDDRRFSPADVDLRVVTGGHLGSTRSEQLRVAEEIGVRRLSSCVTMTWNHDPETRPISESWLSRTGLVYDLLRHIRGRESLVDNDRRLRTPEKLVHVSELSLQISVRGRTSDVPINARIHEDTLTLAGRPLQFGADAAKELIRYFSFGQRAGLAADLAGMFMAINDDRDFGLAVDKFQRSHAPDFELPSPIARKPHDGVAIGRQYESSEADSSVERSVETHVDQDIAKDDTSIPRKLEDGPDLSLGAETDAIDAATATDLGQAESESIDSTYTKDRALGRQRALARQLKSALKGELVPGREEDQESIVTIGGEADGGLGDEEYRKVVVQYESEAGRQPELGVPHQSGWDVRSVDPRTQQVRLIEVKGRGRTWDDAEVVELSAAQIRKAFDTGESWYLYVVEKTAERRYRVLPIANPVLLAAKWILCGESWRMVAEDAREFPIPPD